MKHYGYPRLPDEEYYNAVSEFKRAAGKLLGQTLTMYGYQDMVPGLTDQITGMAEQFGMRVRGKAQPIHVDPPYKPDD